MSSSVFVSAIRQPSFNFSPHSCSKLKSSKVVCRFPRSKSDSFSGFRIAGGVVKQYRRVLDMKYKGEKGRVSAISKSSSSSGGGGAGEDEGVRIMEQERFLSGPPELTADGLQSTLNSLCKWIVSGLFSAIILLRHDPEAMWMVLGSGVNGMMSIVLKRAINQERPVANLKSDPGMPSSHAQSISFIFTFAIVSLIKWAGINEASLTTSGLLLALGSYLSWLRVSQQLHTISQVVVGGLLGSTFYLLCHGLWRGFISRAFESFLMVRIAVILGDACVCIIFVLYVIRDWLTDER